MIDWKAKLTSRKLWAIVAAFVGLLLVVFSMADVSIEKAECL